MFRRGQPHVYVGELQPGSTRLGVVERLTYDTRSDFPHGWLHDNQTVIFESNRSGTFHLYSQKLEERTAQELNTGGEPSVLPQVTPDGQWILYAANPNIVPSHRDRLFRIPVGGGMPEQVPIGGPLDEFGCPLLAGTHCVLRVTEGTKAFIYYDLDPCGAKAANWPGPRGERMCWGTGASRQTVPP